MIKKAPMRIVGYSKKYKYTKLPAQKVKRPSSGSSSEIADQNIRDILGPSPLEFGTVKHESARILRQESIGRRLAERKFVRDLPKEIKKGKIVIARKLKSFDPIKKSTYKPIKSPTSTDIKFQSYPKKFTSSIALKKAKSTSALKRYKKVVSETDVLASRISQRTSPFKHILTETKFIKSKKFKKGLPKGETGKSMLWSPKEYSKGSKIIYARKQAQQDKIFSSGKGYFDPKSQSFKWRPKKKR
jgi:hypothetical protein